MVVLPAELRFGRGWEAVGRALLRQYAEVRPRGPAVGVSQSEFLGRVEAVVPAVPGLGRRAPPATETSARQLYRREGYGYVGGTVLQRLTANVTLVRPPERLAAAVAWGSQTQFRQLPMYLGSEGRGGSERFYYGLASHTYPAGSAVATAVVGAGQPLTLATALFDACDDGAPPPVPTGARRLVCVLSNIDRVHVGRRTMQLYALANNLCFLPHTVFLGDLRARGLAEEVQQRLQELTNCVGERYPIRPLRLLPPEPPARQVLYCATLPAVCDPAEVEVTERSGQNIDVRLPAKQRE